MIFSQENSQAADQEAPETAFIAKLMMKTEEKKVAQEIISRNFSLSTSPGSEPEWKEFREALAERIEELLDHDLEKLLWILYRIDVPEEKAKAALAEKSDRSPAEVLADLIIERQLKKAETRLKFRSKSDGNHAG